MDKKLHVNLVHSTRWIRTNLKQMPVLCAVKSSVCTRVWTLIVATIYLQLMQN